MEPLLLTSSPPERTRPLPASAPSLERQHGLGTALGGFGGIALAVRQVNHVTRRGKKVACAASRAGFKVNTKYRGAVSYGTVSAEELEEAARIRSEYGSERPKQAKSAVPAAKRRLLLKRLQQPGQAKPGYGQAIAQLSARRRETRDAQPSSTSEEPSESEGEDVSAAQEAEAEEPPDAAAEVTSDEAKPGQVVTHTAESLEEGSSGSTSFPGLADTVFRRRAVCLETWEGWPAPMALSAAQRLAEKPRGAAAASMQAAVRSLSAAGEHASAAALLQSLRDGGVDREILERRLNVQTASSLFEEVAVRFGLELQAAGLLSDAWEALMAASAQPRLSSSFRKPTLKALASVSERLANENSSYPREQVRYLRGALDAEVVLQGLSRDRREGLELYMALALEKAGRLQESRELLEAVARRGSARRKRQAEWALLVQDADVGDEPPESVAEMKSIWGQADVPGSTGGRSSGAGRANAMLKRKAQAPFFQTSGVATAVAVAVLALPLALPVLLTLK